MVTVIQVCWQLASRNCSKPVEFYFKNKFEKLLHLAGFIIRIYHDARSSERQIDTDSFSHAGHLVISHSTTKFIFFKRSVRYSLYIISGPIRKWHCHSRRSSSCIRHVACMNHTKLKSAAFKCVLQWWNPWNMVNGSVVKHSKQRNTQKHTSWRSQRTICSFCNRKYNYNAGNLFSRCKVTNWINLLKLTGYVMHRQV